MVQRACADVLYSQSPEVGGLRTFMINWLGELEQTSKHPLIQPE
jgi:hypothetical protein